MHAGSMSMRETDAIGKAVEGFERQLSPENVGRTLGIAVVGLGAAWLLRRFFQ